MLKNVYRACSNSRNLRVAIKTIPYFQGGFCIAGTKPAGEVIMMGSLVIMIHRQQMVWHTKIEDDKTAQTGTLDINHGVG